MGQRRQLIGTLESPGERPKAVTLTANFRSAEWTTIVKVADESIVSDATLSDDEKLRVPVDANGVYVITMEAFFTTPAAADLQFQFTGPASPDVVDMRGWSGAGASTLTQFQETAFSQVNSATTSVTNNNGYISMTLLLQNGVNVGTVNFQWAQNTSNAGTTTVFAGSYMRYLQVGG